MPKHSKAPWQEDGDTYSRIMSAGGGLVAEVWPESPDNHRLSDAQRNRKMADFRVLLAGPEMLAALHHAKRWISETCRNARDEGTAVDTLASGEPAALQPILAAIAKAEGRADG